MMKNNNIPNIPAEKFKFVADNERLHDQKFETKQVSYFRDAFNRFCKNKSSVTAALIILALVVFSIVVPIFGRTTYNTAPERDEHKEFISYTKLLPKNDLFYDLGINFWDGCSDDTVNQANYLALNAVATETGYPVFRTEPEKFKDDQNKTKYNIRLDSYYVMGTKSGYEYKTLQPSEYEAIQKWQNETGLQVIFPAVTDSKVDPNVWYETTNVGAAALDAQGNYVDIYRTSGEDGAYNSLRIDGDPGKDNPNAENRYRYATVTGTSTAKSYKVRVYLYNYFQYKYGFEPSFAFGTTGQGYDIMYRLAGAARFSLIFAICVSVINLSIGAVIGAIEGYYGGAIDMFIERVIDILARVPFMVVATLFQLHLAAKVGPVISMLFAFVLTGWIGMAGTTRMQFYRYKGQEYVLAARVLGASDWRIMFRHIFPNALGTIITSSVLIIPGVIFSESSLTYLGIVNLDSPTMTSVGTMLANARQYLSTFPHTILFPALYISLLEISFNLFGNGLRDAFNPSLRGADE